MFAAIGRRRLREGEIEQALAAKDQQIAALAERDRQWIEDMARGEQELAEELTRLEFARLEELTRLELARADELARKDSELDALRRRLSRLEQEVGH